MWIQDRFTVLKKSKITRIQHNDRLMKTLPGYESNGKTKHNVICSDINECLHPEKYKLCHGFIFFRKTYG